MGDDFMKFDRDKFTLADGMLVMWLPFSLLYMLRDKSTDELKIISETKNKDGSVKVEEIKCGFKTTPSA